MFRTKTKILVLTLMLAGCGGSGGSGSSGGTNGGTTGSSCTENHSCANGSCTCSGGPNDGNSCCDPNDSTCTTNKCDTYCKSCS
jgi:hypothetical protein